jgi:hypothetical protein
MSQNDYNAAPNGGTRQSKSASIQNRNAQFVLDYLRTHPCVDCGESDPVVLEFDHVRGKKDGSISAMVSAGRPIAVIQAEIEKCDVRCANCHRETTVTQLGWMSRNRK